MRQKSSLDEWKILKIWLDGGSYRKINEETDESIGSISNKINKARRSYPDLDELRRLNLFLKENGLKIKTALIGLNFVSKFKKLGIEEEKVGEVISQITKYGKEISKILDEAKKLYPLKEKTGMEYSQITEDYKRKMDVLAEYNQKMDKLKKECEELRSRIEDLKELEKIQGLARKHDITENKLDMIIQNQLKLEQMKFSPQAAEILAMELSKIPMTPKRASEIITSIIVKYGELNNAINSLEARIEVQKKTMEKGRNLLDDLTKEVEEKNSLVEQMERKRETRMQEIRSEYENSSTKLEEEYKKKKTQLGDEILVLSQKLEALKTDYDKMFAEIQMAQSIMNLLQEPKNMTIIQLKELSNRIKTAVDERELGFIYATSFDTEIARQQVIRCLSEIVKMDVVSKKQYEQTKGDLDGCSKELGNMRTEVTQLQPLKKEVTKRDEAVEILSESLFPIDHPLKRNWIILCPKCHRTSIFIPETKDSESLLRNGYITFECQPCRQKTNLNLKDLYQNILQHGQFGIVM